MHTSFFNRKMCTICLAELKGCLRKSVLNIKIPYPGKNAMVSGSTTECTLSYRYTWAPEAIPCELCVTNFEIDWNLILKTHNYIYASPLLAYTQSEYLNKVYTLLYRDNITGQNAFSSLYSCTFSGRYRPLVRLRSCIIKQQHIV